MSQFRDTFTREDDNLLGYDDSAAMYFAATIVVCMTVPWTMHMIYRLLSFPKTMKQHFFSRIFVSSAKKVEEHSCKCSYCGISRLKNPSTTTPRWSWFEILFLIGLWVVLVKLGLKLIAAPKSLTAFDPFEILNIGTSATLQEIKKAYRRLSLKFHPDQNPNDPSAAATFVMISKAYQALTDEVAKANYEKYGNPDGRSILKIGIGLPKLLIDAEYRIVILVSFFLVLLFIIPLVFIFYYQKQQKYAQNGIQVETLRTLSHYLNEISRTKNAAEILSASSEFMDLPVRQTDDACLKELSLTMLNPKLKTADRRVQKSNILLNVHLNRQHDSLTPDLKEDLNFILRHSMLIVGSMFEITVINRWPNASQAMISFKKCLIQAIEDDVPLQLQIPHITDEKIRQLLRNKSSVLGKDKDLHSTPEKLMKTYKLTEEQMKDVAAFMEHIPVVELSGTVKVDDEDEIVEGDIATISLTMIRTNLKKDEIAGMVHAPYFPQQKKEEWIFFVFDKVTRMLMTFSKSKDPRRVVQVSMQFQVLKRGTHNFIILAMCDSYMGVDKVTELKFHALGENEVKREIFLHPDDAALDKEPSLLQSMLGQYYNEESSSDDD